MIDEMARGPAASNASHCAAKSGGVVSPASGDSAGPHWARKRRIASSFAESRMGGGSGIHKLSWNEPLLDARNSLAQARIPSGFVSSAPIPPMPPAFATALASVTGDALAIGPCKIGIWRPWRAANLVARSSGRVAESLLADGMIASVAIVPAD